MKRAFIVHGWGAGPQDHWFPWLTGELERRGWQAHALAMPDSAYPALAAWVRYLADAVMHPDSGTVLVGHSIGAMAILRYLESLPDTTRIAGTVLVAGFLENTDVELASFFHSPLDCGRVMRAAGNIIAIESDDDAYIPTQSGALIRERLGAELITLHGAGHMNAEDGYATLPAALDAVLRILP